MTVPVLGGRPKKFPTVQHLIDGCNNYFADEGNKPYTISGFCVFLDTTFDVLKDYENGVYGSEYSAVVKRVKAVILAGIEAGLMSGNGNPAGKIFILKNRYGWADKQEVNINEGSKAIDMAKPGQLADKISIAIEQVIINQAVLTDGNDGSGDGAVALTHDAELLPDGFGSNDDDSSTVIDAVAQVTSDEGADSTGK